MWVTPTARAKCNNKRCQICSHYNNSAITGAISLKLGVKVGIHQAMHSYVLRLGCYCTCARAGLQISRTAGPIALKFGMRLGSGW